MYFNTLLPCIISGILLILSFPNFNFSFLAWVALLPLFFAVKDKKPAQAFLFGYVTGLIFYLGSMYWLIHVTLAGYILSCLYLSLYFGLFTVFSRNTQYASRITVFAVPALWVALEYLRTNFATGFGWNLLGYSQCNNLPVIQIADITGVYGVSFLIVAVNAAVYELIGSRVQGPGGQGPGARGGVKRFTVYAITLVLLGLTLIYGYFRLSREPAGDALKVSVVQGNISQDRKWDKAYETFIFDRYTLLTRVASTDEPDLIVWPETSFPGYFGSDGFEEIADGIKELARYTQTPILFGSPVFSDTGKNSGVTNSAILLNKDGELVEQYDKLHLVPFGEYVPFEPLLGFVHNIASAPIGDFISGNEYTVFKLPDESRITNDKRRTFSVLICFEDIFPRLARRFVKEGAALLVNITNDAWFKKTAAPYQHTQASVFRAVENRVPVIRAANTGLSCFIDSKGRIRSRVENSRGEDIYVDGYATHTANLSETQSPYTTYGDIFAYLCIIASITLLILQKS